MIEWPSSSKLAQLLCHVEKKFAKHIGPEEFVQCNPNLIKEQSNYDVPTASLSFPSSTSTTHHETKKKTCNLENYFEWSNRLRLLVANEILQVTLPQLQQTTITSIIQFDFLSIPSLNVRLSAPPNAIEAAKSSCGAASRSIVCSLEIITQRLPFSGLFADSKPW